MVAAGLLVPAPAASAVTGGTAGTAGAAETAHRERGAYAAGRTYYVDARKGDDSAAGTSAATAWQSLDAVNSADLGPGDTVRFKRGNTWTGTLTLSGKGTAASPIIVATYGGGISPKITSTEGSCVVVSGSNIRITGLRTSKCGWAGFEVSGDSNLLDSVYADRNVTGVQITGSRNTVEDSILTDNNRMSVNDSGGDDDSGAFGVLLNGDDNLVTGNLITGSYASSHDYGTDGAAVEVFNGDRNRVTHNIARNNETFVELGAKKGKTATGNIFAHNVVTSTRKRGSFLVTRGARHVVGPVKGTIAVHNSVYLPQRDTIGWSCHDGCSPSILRLRNNVIVVGGEMGFEDGKGADEAGSLYYGRSMKFKLGPRSIVARPRFSSTKSLRLEPGSPARGRGQKLSAAWFGGASLARDIAGKPLPADPDAGAYQN
ncbi:NosD domain-containing protein [Planobispora siamensis]|nr:NosD domain-containing protein [Planobispora siamensis]